MAKRKKRSLKSKGVQLGAVRSINSPGEVKKGERLVAKSARKRGRKKK